MARERSPAPEEEHEMLCGYPVVHTEDGNILGGGGDLELVSVAEYCASRIIAYSEFEKHCHCPCPRDLLAHDMRTVQQTCRECIGGPTWQDRVRALEERIGELMSVEMGGAGNDS